MQTPLSLHSPQAAHKVRCTIQHTSHRHGILAHNVEHYSVFYIVGEDTVSVARVLYSASDLVRRLRRMK